MDDCYIYTEVFLAYEQQVPEEEMQVVADEIHSSVLVIGLLFIKTNSQKNKFSNESQKYAIALLEQTQFNSVAFSIHIAIKS